MWTPRAEIILQRDEAMSTHWPRIRICMRRTHDVELCCSNGLWHHIDTALLNANLVHQMGTAKGSAVKRRPGAYR
jgi:hypothetical protein